MSTIPPAIQRSKTPPRSSSQLCALRQAEPKVGDAAALDHRAGPLDRFADQVVVGPAGASLFAVRLPPARLVEDPFMKAPAALAEWQLDAVVRSGDEAIQRHRDVGEDQTLSHGSPPRSIPDRARPRRPRARSRARRTSGSRP